MNTSKLRGYTTNNATDNVFDYVSGHDKRNFTSDSNAKGRNVMTGGADDALLKSRKVSSILPEGIPLEHSPDLPDSDLLKALHTYAAQYMGARGGKEAFQTMDETALLALGILVEEKVKELLGKNGHKMYEDQSDKASVGGFEKQQSEDPDSEIEAEN